jgi:hypothetical protein
LELPLDVPNARQEPWNQGQDILIGNTWMLYYNAIAYSMDMGNTYLPRPSALLIGGRADALGTAQPAAISVGLPFHSPAVGDVRRQERPVLAAQLIVGRPQKSVGTT